MEFSVAKIFSLPLRLLAFPCDLRRRKLSGKGDHMEASVGTAEFVLPIVQFLFGILDLARNFP